LRAWDGSEAGPGGAPVVVLRSRLALRRLLWQPGELGLAEAYIAKEIDVDGDLAEGLSSLGRHARERGPGLPRPRPGEPAEVAAAAVRLGILGPRPPAPGAARARLTGTLHTSARDRAARARWDAFAALVGEPTARVWRLYLVGSSLAFAERRMGVDQIFAVRPTPTGDAGMSGTPHGWYGRDGSR
jgi:hypothetical protein